MLVLNLPAFENKKYTAYDGNGPYGKSRPRKSAPALKRTELIFCVRDI